jgi:hypothetical protein
MALSRRTRIARLEEQVAYREQERRERLDQESLKEYNPKIVTHAAILALLISRGNPKVGEPLAAAWKRTGYPGAASPFNAGPNDYSESAQIAADIYARIISDFPDVREKDNLDEVFASAPPWLIWFTCGDFTADELGLKLPDLSSIVIFNRKIVGRYPALPSGAFDYEPRLDWKPSSETERYFLLKQQTTSRRMSSRERRRALTVEPERRSKPWVRWPLRLDDYDYIDN